MMFFVGLHHPNHAVIFPRAMISVNRLADRKSPFAANDWILDSGAFSLLNRFHDYPNPPEQYAEEIGKWSRVDRLVAAVTQDYMCEPFMLKKTGMTVAAHQVLTIFRYDTLADLVTSTYLLPVLQGWTPQDYQRHVRMYGKRLAWGAWVGVGSVCRRNGNPDDVVSILRAIHTVRPDLRLHGFGLKTTALACPKVREHLWSSDSMAWSFAARKDGRGTDANRWEEAAKFVEQIEALIS